MGFVARATQVAVALFGLMGGLEASAQACLLSTDCSGATPICDLTTLKCRSCAANLECGAILTGKVCATSGAKAGQCVGCGHNADCNGSTPVCDPLTLTCEGCATSADCGGMKPACDLATHTCKACTGDFLNVGGLSTMCPSVLEPACVTSGPNAGSCTECSATNTLACAGHLQAPACVASTGKCGCSQDATCAANRVCDLTVGLAGQCVAGCHVALGADSCGVGLQCSVLDGRVGVCVSVPPIPEAGAPACSSDSDCGLLSGLVCDLTSVATCTVGCHVGIGGADSCPIDAHCSILNGGLGVCLANGNDAGADAGNGSDAGDAGAAGDASTDAASDGATGTDAGAADSGSESDAGVDSGAHPGRDAGYADATASGSDGGGGTPTADASGTSPDASPSEFDDSIIEGGGCSTSPAAPDATSVLGLLGALMMMARGRRKK